MGMGVSGVSGGTAIYAMQKAQETPKLLLDLLRQSAAAGPQSLAGANRAATGQIPDRATVTGKGTIIDLVA